jgi:tRNA(His) 5'-end guanylyltransferase
MTNNDDLTIRMKTYEAVSDLHLVRRMPVIIRLDGKNFSNFTRSLRKPFDNDFAKCMSATALRLCAEAQNCRMAFHGSDEISLLLTDYKTLNTAPWFDNDVMKIASISAAIATAAFAEEMSAVWGNNKKFPVFDSRCFNIPERDVVNYFVWRQRDTMRNSVSAAAQSAFSHKELHGVNRDQMIDMLKLRKGIDWNNYGHHFRMGSVVVRDAEIVGNVTRHRWTEHNAPLFKDDRQYVEKFLQAENNDVLILNDKMDKAIG